MKCYSSALKLVCVIITILCNTWLVQAVTTTTAYETAYDGEEYRLNCPIEPIDPNDSTVRAPGWDGPITFVQFVANEITMEINPILINDVELPDNQTLVLKSVNSSYIGLWRCYNIPQDVQHYINLTVTDRPTVTNAKSCNTVLGLSITFCLLLPIICTTLACVLYFKIFEQPVQGLKGYCTLALLIAPSLVGILVLCISVPVTDSDECDFTTWWVIVLLLLDIALLGAGIALIVYVKVFNGSSRKDNRDKEVAPAHCLVPMSGNGSSAVTGGQGKRSRSKDEETVGRPQARVRPQPSTPSLEAETLVDEKDGDEPVSRQGIYPVLQEIPNAKYKPRPQPAPPKEDGNKNRGLSANYDDPNKLPDVGERRGTNLPPLQPENDEPRKRKKKKSKRRSTEEDGHDDGQ